MLTLHTVGDHPEDCRQGALSAAWLTFAISWMLPSGPSRHTVSKPGRGFQLPDRNLLPRLHADHPVIGTVSVLPLFEVVGPVDVLPMEQAGQVGPGVIDLSGICPGFTRDC